VEIAFCVVCMNKGIRMEYWVRLNI